MHIESYECITENSLMAVAATNIKIKKGGVFLLAYYLRSFGCVVVDGLMVGLFAVASTL